MSKSKSKMNFDAFVLSDHAYQRAVERLNLKKMDVKSVNSQIVGILKDSSYITETVSTKGDKCAMYAHKGIGIALDTKRGTIVTVNKFNTVPHSHINKKAKELYFKEIKKLERLELAKIKRHETLKLEVEYEIAELKLRLHKTRSENVRTECINKINLLNEGVTEHERQLNEIYDMKRRVVNSVITYL